MILATAGSILLPLRLITTIMKKVLNVLMVLTICAVAFQSCKSGNDEKEVQGIANDFITAIANEEYDKAKELATDETDKMLEQLKMFSSMVPDSLQAEMDSARAVARNATYTFGTTTFNEEGTEATIKFTSSEAPENEETIVLKKVDKKWLADLEAGMPSN